jgi:hypothetical protein
MIMALFRGMCRPDPQYSTVSIREANYTRLRYRTRLSRLHIVDPPFSISFSDERPFSTPDPEQENNQGTLYKSQVPQADLPMIGLHNSNQRRDREKVTDHIRDKYTKRDIKLKHDCMNIIAYRTRHNELVAPPEPAPQEGQ